MNMRNKEREKRSRTISKQIIYYYSDCLVCGLEHIGFSEAIYVCHHCKSNRIAQHRHVSQKKYQKQIQSKLRYVK